MGAFIDIYDAVILTFIFVLEAYNSYQTKKISDRAQKIEESLMCATEVPVEDQHGNVIGVERFFLLDEPYDSNTNV